MWRGGNREAGFQRTRRRRFFSSEQDLYTLDKDVDDDDIDEDVDEDVNGDVEYDDEEMMLHLLLPSFTIQAGRRLGNYLL